MRTRALYPFSDLKVCFSSVPVGVITRTVPSIGPETGPSKISRCVNGIARLVAVVRALEISFEELNREPLEINDLLSELKSLSLAVLSSVQLVLLQEEQTSTDAVTRRADLLA